LTSPPTAPPATTAPAPTALEWTVTAPPEAESGEVPYPVTFTVFNPTATTLQYTAVVCDKVRRVTVEEGNVLLADMNGSGCNTNQKFIAPGATDSWVQPVRMRSGEGKIPPGDYSLSVFGLKLPVRVVSPA
jgi:hypothetical protein